MMCPCQQWGNATTMGVYCRDPGRSWWLIPDVFDELYQRSILQHIGAHVQCRRKSLTVLCSLPQGNPEMARRGQSINGLLTLDHWFVDFILFFVCMDSLFKVRAFSKLWSQCKVKNWNPLFRTRLKETSSSLWSHVDQCRSRCVPSWSWHWPWLGIRASRLLGHI